jgi:CubicO group peptidase (beta-lactamase class C family)
MRLRCGLAGAVILLLSARLAAAVEPVFPGERWEKRDPAQAGLDPAALDRFTVAVGGRGCIVRHGFLVHTWGDVTRRGDVASAAKPLYTHFLLRAIEEEKIKGLDEPVAALEPRLAGKDRLITWRHLATQTSCYGVAEQPGEAFDYSDWQMALFWDLLFLRVYGASYESVDEKVLRPSLTDLIGCEDRPTFLAFGIKDRPGRLAMSPRDFARFGLLYLRGGRWKGKQLIRSENVKLATATPLPNSIPRTQGQAADMLPNQRSIGGRNNQTDHLGSYSLLWWTNGIDRDAKRHWEGVPQDAYGCFGHGGKRAMVVIPSLELVASWNDSRIDGREKETQALRLLVAAVK